MFSSEDGDFCDCNQILTISRMKEIQVPNYAYLVKLSEKQRICSPNGTSWTVSLNLWGSIHLALSCCIWPASESDTKRSEEPYSSCLPYNSPFQTRRGILIFLAVILGCFLGALKYLPLFCIREKKIYSSGYVLVLQYKSRK